MLKRMISLTVAALFSACLMGCGAEETKLSKAEEENFKGSNQMTPEAQQKMKEGMEWMAKYNAEQAQKRQGGAAPATNN